ASRIVDAGGDLELGADGDVAAVFSRSAEDPRLCTDERVTEAADLEDAGGRIDLIARAIEDGDVGDETPVRGELVFDADVEDVLVIADGVGARDFGGPLEVLVGVEDAVADVEREVVDGKARGWAALVRGYELGEDALVSVSGDAALGEGAAGREENAGRGENKERLRGIHRGLHAVGRSVSAPRNRCRSLACSTVRSGERVVIHQRVESGLNLSGRRHLRRRIARRELCA